MMHTLILSGRCLFARVFRALERSVSPVIAIAALVAALAPAPGCERQQPQGPSSPNTANRTPNRTPPAADVIELVFPYGSEKKNWLTEATEAYNAARHKIASGKVVQVAAKPMGSGETMEEVLSGRLQAHIVSPASSAFIKLGNAQSQAATGSPVVGSTQDLVLSPVIIAMWKPMAEKMGWGQQPLGWADVQAIAMSPDGWASKSMPQWGTFKFGHTHPEFSNSGLMAVIAQAYAGAGKVADLTLSDLAKPEVSQYMAKIQRSMVHYGDSTGFFGSKMFKNGPQYLSAAVLYENMVIESYDSTKYQLPFPVVAIYPKEGTFWSEHPVGVVERPWVTADHREAAADYIKYLLARPQQERAMTYGFRPSDVSIPLGAPFDAAHGVDPREPKTTLAVPGADVIAGVIDLWKKAKKKSNVVLVLDTSGSMAKESRLVNAKAGAKQFIEFLGDEDVISFLPFSSKPAWALKNQPLSSARQEVLGDLDALYPEGGTALYDATLEGFKAIQEHPDPERISAVVVLTDGDDRNSVTKLEALLAAVRSDGETRNVRIFTIGYGREAMRDVLQKIADQTQAKYYDGTPENIRQVFKEIATFF